MFVCPSGLWCFSAKEVYRKRTGGSNPPANAIHYDMRRSSEELNRMGSCVKSNSKSKCKAQHLAHE